MVCLTGRCSHDGRRGIIRNAAGVLPAVEPKVTLLPPVSSPRVLGKKRKGKSASAPSQKTVICRQRTNLHDPVGDLLAKYVRLRAVTNQKHGVVNIAGVAAAKVALNNAAPVYVERGGINGDGDRAVLMELRLQLLLVLAQRRPRRQLGSDLGLVKVAGRRARKVRRGGKGQSQSGWQQRSDSPAVLLFAVGLWGAADGGVPSWGRTWPTGLVQHAVRVVIVKL